MSKPPYGLMADLHLHAWSAFATTVEHVGMPQNSRLVGLLQEIERCAKETRAAGGEKIVIAGDVFHVRGSVAPTVLNATRDWLCKVGESTGVQFLVIPGNHDLEGKESNRLSSAVTALECKHVEVINEVCRIGDLILVPWVEKIEDLKALLADCEIDAGTDLILHAPIDGVIKGLPAHGLDPDYLAGLGFRRVFAGHYHHHKQMHPGVAWGEGDPRGPGEVYSIGALAHHTWSDVNSKAGFLIVHEDRVDWRKSHLPEFIDLSQLVDFEPDEIPLIVDRNYVRVKVEASKAKEVEKARQELLDMGAKAVIVQAEPKPPAREGSESRPTVAAGASLEVSVSDFIKAMLGVPAADVTKAALAVLTAVDEMEV